MCGSKGKRNKYSNLTNPEKTAKAKLLQLHEGITRVSNAILVVIMIIVYVGAFMIGVYYKYALGDAVAMMGFIAGPALVTYTMRKWPKMGIASSSVAMTAIMYATMAILAFLYLGSRSLELGNCNDPEKTGADQCFAALCESNESVLIGIIVFAAVVVLVMFGISIATCCMCKPSKTYEDLRKARKDKEERESKKVA